MDTHNPGPWTAEQQKILSDSIDDGLTTHELIQHVCAQTGRSTASVERRLIKIGYLNRHGLRWNRAWGHVR